MRRHAMTAVLCGLVLLAACGGVKTGSGADLHALVAGSSYTLTVRSDDPLLPDATLHEMAVKELSPLLPIGAAAPVAGEVQVRFSTERVLSDPGSSSGVNGAINTLNGVGGGVTTPAPRTYLNGRLLIAVKDGSGTRLWHADCAHDGRFSLAATPEDVARLCFKLVADRLRKEMREAGVTPRGGAKP